MSMNIHRKEGRAEMDEATEKIVEQRVNDTIEMLKKKYQVDEHGLADLLGVNRAWWTRRRKQNWKEYSAKMLFGIANLANVSADWLLMTSREAVK